MNRICLPLCASLALLFAGCISYDQPRHYKTAPRPRHLPAWGQETPPPPPPQAKHGAGHHAPDAKVPPPPKR